MRSETKLARSRLMLRLAVAFVFVAVPVVVIACGSEDDTRYGGPAGLSGKKVEPVAAGASTNAAGTLSPCTDGGVSALEGGTCAVHFADTIFTKYMSATGTWKCADTNCHGPQGSAGTSTNAPTIDGMDPRKAYVALAQFTGINAEPYINGCSTNPGASAMDCNLNGACSPTMPQSGAGVSPPGPTPQEIEDVETWLKCGAPFN
ncbi:MAG: hypothetical protein ABI183_25680 [Polyangiaceae bacterium]